MPSMTRAALRLSAVLVFLACSGPAQVRADYLYSVSGLPGPITSGQSIVVFTINPALNHPIAGNVSTNLVLASVLGFSANFSGGDTFNAPLTLKIDFADPAHPGSDAAVSFA